MADQVAETYNPAPIAANGSFVSAVPTQLGGFFCATAGSIAIESGGVPLLAATAVVAGTFYPLPFSFGNGVTVTLSGGASGLLGWL